jgi:hypothetical protein
MTEFRTNVNLNKNKNDHERQLIIAAVVTVSCRRVILEKVIVTQLIKKLPALCRTKIEGLLL